MDLSLFLSKRLSYQQVQKYSHIPFETHLLMIGWTEREKEGLPRLIEALECNIWSSSERILPTINITTQNTNIEMAESKEETNETKEIEVKPINQPSLPTNNDLDDDEEDDILNNFSTIIDEVRKAREEAMKGEISDYERRKRAEDMAMKFSQMLLGDDDEDDDDDE